MTKQVINTGTAANSRNGDPLRTAFSKTNSNFTELYTAVGTIPTNTNQLTNGAGFITNSSLSGYALTSAIPDVSNFITAEDIPRIPTDVSDLTDTQSLLGGGSANTADWAFTGNVAYNGADFNQGLYVAPGGESTSYVFVPGNSESATVPIQIVNGSSLGQVQVSVHNKVWQFDGEGDLTLPEGGDIVDSTGDSVLGDAVLSVDIASTAYKGFTARYGRVYDNNNPNEVTVSKIVIYRQSASTGSGSTIHPTSSRDDFAVTGLGDSDVVAMFMLYGDTNGAKSVATLKLFVEAAVDSVLLAGGVEGEDNTIEDMQSAFYTNINTLTAAAGGLVANFRFYENFANTTTGVTTVREGSGAVFEIGDNGLGAYTASGIQSNGINYLPGHKILVLGTDLGGVTPDNDCVITVDSISEGGAIFQWSVSGVSAGTVSALYAPVTGTNYQVGSGATFSGIGKNDDGTLYADFNSQGNGYVAGDVLTLPGSDLQSGVSPLNDITLTVISLTSFDGLDGRINQLTVTGVFPNIWRNNSIGDGGRDQYDTANFINTDLATQISYNGGVIVEDAEAQFGVGSKYVVVYDASIFGVLATGSSATLISTSGNSGADGRSTTDTGELQKAAFTQLNAVPELAIVTGALTFPDGTEQTTAFTRVKSTAPGSRRIEEAVGYSQVTVTERTTSASVQATVFNSNAGSTWQANIVRTPALTDIQNSPTQVVLQVSLDQTVWYSAYIGGSSEAAVQLVFENGSGNLPLNTDDVIYYRTITGGDSQVWWDTDNLPNGSTNFRGAVIDYHAYTNDGTIIGTIHIVDDDGDMPITHTEVSSGGSNSMYDNLWLVLGEGEIRYVRVDGVPRTLKIHWTAKVFYGSETYD